MTRRRPGRREVPSGPSRCRAGRVNGTDAGGSGDTTHDNDGLELLREHPSTVCLAWLREELYTRVLLYSRLVVMPMLGEARGGYA